MINVSEGNATKIRYVEEKLKFINSIIDEILPVETAIEYKPKVKKQICKMASLDWNTNDTFSYKTFTAPQVKTELYPYKDENSAYKILLLFLAAEYLIIIISVNKKEGISF